MSRKSRMSKVRKSRRRRSLEPEEEQQRDRSRAGPGSAHHPPARRCPQRQRAAPALARAIRQLPRLDLLPLPVGLAPMRHPAVKPAAHQRKGERARPVRPHWSVEPETHSLWSRPLGAAARLAAAGLCPAVLARGTAAQHRVPSSGSELGANLWRGRPTAPVVLPWRGPGWARSTP